MWGRSITGQLLVSLGKIKKYSSIQISGILSQTIHSELDALLPPGHNYTTYIAASYVKWVEAAGARAVPIIVENEISTNEYYTKVGNSFS